MLKIAISLLIFNLLVFTQWTSLNSGTPNNLRSVNFIDQQTGFSCGDFGTMIKTTNGGTNWAALNPGTAYNLRSVHFINANTGLSCGYNAGSSIIIRTTNGGANWNSVYTGTNPLTSVTFSGNSSAVCVGNSGTTLYSTDGGTSWLVGQPTGYLVTFYTSFMLNALTGYCGGVNTIFSPLFAKTTNGGANWTYSSFMVNNNEATLMDVHFFNEQNGTAVSVLWNGQGGISVTTNGGNNWSHQIVSSALYGIDFAAALTGYIAGSGGSVFKSTDGGNNWSQQTTGSSAFLRAVDFVDSVYGFAAGDGGTILKTTNGGVLGFTQIGGDVPKEFILYQNYPNPFNPKTKIKFQAPLSPPEGGKQVVSIRVYDVLGKEVQTLVNESLSPGTYEVEFNGTNFASGIYYYALTSGDFKATRKLILLK